jgi:hypothetical protein
MFLLNKGLFLGGLVAGLPGVVFPNTGRLGLGRKLQ